MRRVTCWNDLAPFGFVCLTGEACGLGYRILFDVTETGRKILGKCFGIPDMRLAEAWNRGDPADPDVGSIMMSREMLVPIGIFALLESGCVQVWQDANGSLLGIERDDPPDQVASVEKMCQPELVRKYAYQGTAGDRNVHLMSGRTV
jgi:hypothetical protein